jgi:prepilin-type N-terminal cleavage/methylation domain-containing protein
MRERRGFTLWEIATVMLIIAITASLAAPAFVEFGATRTPTSADALLKLLHDTRAIAIEHSVEARLVIDPKTGHYRVDTSSSFGAGRVAEDSLRLAANEGLITDLPRLRFVFRATGAAFGDSVTVRGSDSTRLVTVDTWSGVAHAISR